MGTNVVGKYVTSVRLVTAAATGIESVLSILLV